MKCYGQGPENKVVEKSCHLLKISLLRHVIILSLHTTHPALRKKCKHSSEQTISSDLNFFLSLFYKSALLHSTP